MHLEQNIFGKCKIFTFLYISILDMLLSVYEQHHLLPSLLTILFADQARFFRGPQSEFDL